MKVKVAKHSNIEKKDFSLKALEITNTTCIPRKYSKQLILINNNILFPYNQKRLRKNNYHFIKLKNYYQTDHNHIYSPNLMRSNGRYSHFYVGKKKKKENESKTLIDLSKVM